MAYTSEILIKEVVILFQNQPEYRDDRWATMKVFIDRYHPEGAPDIDSMMKVVRLSQHVDRAFRHVQQHIPSLRGSTWLQRQRMAGELPNITDADMIASLKKITNQLKLELIL